METLIDGLRVASPYVLMSAIYYAAVVYPFVVVRRRRRATRGS